MKKLFAIMENSFSKARSFILAFALICIANITYTQVSGTIIDASTGDPLIGASVVVQGTTNGTITDIDGNYTLNANQGDVLLVSYVGFEDMLYTVDGNLVNVSLSQGILVDEVVVTGYAIENKRQTTGAVSIVKASEISAIPSGNVEQQLQGRVAGLTVITNGQPGTTSQIRVRGFGAFGGNQPLYVVDGVPVESTDFLNPDDIETTTVLKDAASASIYGARAANGVIVYTTKQSSRKDTKMKVTYNGMYGITDPNVGSSPAMLNPQQMAEWTHVAYRNNAAANGTEVQYTHPQYGSNATPVIPDYLHANGANGVVGTIDQAAIQAAYDADPENVFLIRPNLEGTNWYDAITRSAPIHRHSLGFNGGTESGRYYIGLGAQLQDGILLENSFQRYSFRANSEWDLNDYISVGQNLQLTYRSVVGQQGGQGGIGVADDESEVLSAYRMPTIIPVFDEFGSYASTKASGFNNPRNPVRRLVNNNGSDQGFSNTGFGNFYLLIKPIEGLTLKSSFGGSVSNNYFTNYGFRYFGDSEPEASNSFQEGSGFNRQWVFTNTASYKTQIGVHGITLLGGMEALNTGAGRGMNGSGINPFSTDLDFINLNTIQSPQVNSFLYKGVNFYSLFGKADYNYNDKYYLTGVLRRDGSSRFGSESRFGVFPAVSAAWRVTSEPFMEDLNFIDDLKIRGGWGQMGNSNNVNPNNQYSLYASSNGSTLYPINGQASGADTGFSQSRIGNPAAKWETSTTLNLGFDATLLNNKLDVILDWWTKDTDDLLFNVPLPGVAGNGAAAPSVNVASMTNKGVDIQLIYKSTFTSDVRYEINLTSSFLKNEITSLAEGIDFFGGGGYRGINPIRNAVGHGLSAFYGYRVEGYFNSEAEVASANQPGAGLGRFKYEDINNDGEITPEDRDFIGSPIPDYTGGLTLNLGYKGFNIETYFYASVGNDIWNQSKWFTDFFGSFEGSAKGIRALQSWTPELGDNALAPIWESASNLSTNSAENSWYVEDGSYLRLQRLGLSYDLGSDILNGIGVGSMSVGFSANNILTFTGYSGLDPGVGGGADTNFGIDVGNYPVTPSYVFNVSLGF